MEYQHDIPTNRIVPIRFIPFDIGCSINVHLAESINKRLRSKFNQVSKDDDIIRLLAISSPHLISAFHISDNINLYIFDFGIGVFTVKGKDFIIEEERYADKYCACRKKSHETYLKTSNIHSKSIREIVNILRCFAAENSKALRISAQESWEYRGLSYVMTVSHVVNTDGNFVYEAMTEQEKLNLQIMLEPSIAHKEDSLIYSCYNEVDEEDCHVDLSQLDTPKNMLFSEKNAIYISWAAVLIYGSDIDQNLQNMVTALEIGLQAMWMNTYCLYENLVQKGKKEKMLVSHLQTELFTFRRMLNEFKRISDSSLPSYVRRIREELIRTSGIDGYAENYQAELEYLIAETNSINAEKQKKYSWLNELLLFLIAFIQIAPMLYRVLSSGFPALKPIPVIAMALIVVIAAIILIKKD